MKHTNRKAIAVLLLFLVLLTAFSGCSKSASPADADNTTEAPTMAAPEEPMPEPEATPEPAPESTASENSDALGFTASKQAENSSTASLSEKIIYSGFLSIETVSFDQSISSVESMVQEFGGFIESSQVDGRSEYHDDGTTSMVDRNAYYVLRIPCASFQSFLSRSGSIGNVLSSNTSAANITSSFTDTEARKKSLEVQEERLLAMLEKTEDVDSLVALESRLSEVRYEIDNAQRQLINWQNSVDYSTVTLQLQEVELYTPVVPVQRSFGNKLKDSLADGWNGFTRFLKEFILWLASALPTLIVLAVLAVAAVFLIRRRLRKKATKYTVTAPEPPAPPKDPE